MSDTSHNPHFSYRPDIDGLRAVAILLVVIFHAYPKFLKGGFIGVDIFFVISGYLITSIILKQQSQNNFSLLDFYSRRIKRIFPSLIVVLTFALVAGWYILLENEYELLGKHIAAGSVYVSNFVLQSESGYFDIDSELKPLLHLWSLAIEEQFYLAFPLLLIFGGRFKINPLVIISTCLGVSFLLNVIQIDEKPTEVFFFPTSRAWELLIGSLIAYLSIHSIGKKQAEQHANWLAWFGVLLIFAAWIFLNSKTILFPSWWALMPTIGAASLIFAGETAWFNRKVLASNVAIFIGLISYPLYLWHWVLLSFLKITEIEKLSSLLRLSILIVSFFLAFLTYQYVEKNIRFQKSKFISLGLLGCLLAIGVAGYVVKQQKGFPNHHPELLNQTDNELEPNQKIYLTNELSTPECLERYKTFTPGFCLQKNIKEMPTTLLIGDSHANHLYDGLLNKTSIGNLLNLGRGACIPFFNLPHRKTDCQNLMTKSLTMALETSSINTIILAAHAVIDVNQEENFSLLEKIYNFFTKSKQNDLNDFYLIYQKSMQETLERLLAKNKKVIFVLDTPFLGFSPYACIERPFRLTGDSVKKPCAVSRPYVDNRRKQYLIATMEVLKKFPNVLIWDTISALCDENYCWAEKDGKILYHDDNHLNTVGAIYLSNHLHI